MCLIRRVQRPHSPADAAAEVAGLSTPLSEPPHDLGRSCAVCAGHQQWSVGDLVGTVANLADLDLEQPAGVQGTLLAFGGNPHIEDGFLREIGEGRNRFDAVDLVGCGHREHRQRLDGRGIGWGVGVLDRLEIVNDGAAENELGGDVDPFCDLPLFSDALDAEGTTLIPLSISARWPDQVWRIFSPSNNPIRESAPRGK